MAQYDLLFMIQLDHRSWSLEHTVSNYYYAKFLTKNIDAQQGLTKVTKKWYLGFKPR